MRTWGRRAAVAAAVGVAVAALGMGAPGVAFAEDPETSPPDSAVVTEPVPDTGPVAPPSDPVLPSVTEPSPPPDPPPAATTPPDDAATPAIDAPIAQVAPAVTVTPSTDLENLQTVTVSGSGFTPGAQIGWAACTTGGTIADDCDVNRSGVGTTDTAGAFSASFTVRRILHTANGDFDCASGVDACRIAAAKLSDYSESGGATIDFDPSVPLPPPPTFAAAPTVGLVEGQTIVVLGGGFPANSGVTVQQCVTATPTLCRFVGGLHTSAAGGFFEVVTVHRMVVSPPFASVDCASSPGVCELVATAVVDFDAKNAVPLSFDPAGPLPSTAIQISPNSSLVQFQSVTVTGTGFSGGGVQLVECKTDPSSFEDCNLNAFAFAPLAPGGTFTLNLSVRRVLHLRGGDFDCASAAHACSLIAASFAIEPAIASAPLDFDAGAPLPPPPSISVAPDTDLVQGQAVTVTGENFAPNAFVRVGECVTGADPLGYCVGIGAYVLADATGSFSTSLAVRRGVLDSANYPPSVVDCASAPQKCSVQAVGDGGDTAAAPIEFDPSVPIAVPVVTVDPQFGVADRAVVRVHASGFAPGEGVAVSQCDADAPAFAFSCSDTFPYILTADADGNVDTALRVHRTLTYSEGVVFFAETANCAEAVGECVVRVQSVDDPLAVTDVPLGFDPTAVAPPPVISTTPIGPYADGEQVVVHGSGFTPNAVLGMAQCAADAAPDGHTCDSQAGGLFDGFTADDSGEFTRTVTMHAQVHSTDATIDCTGAGSGCVLFAANRSDYGAERASMPISVTSGTTTPQVPGSATRSLAFTGAGSRTVPLACAGFVLLLIGGALLLVARRGRVAA